MPFHAFIPKAENVYIEMAGLLTCLSRCVFPSLQTVTRLLRALMKLTAAGTVQEFHLIPFYAGKRKLPAYHFAAKIEKR